MTRPFQCFALTSLLILASCDRGHGVDGESFAPDSARDVSARPALRLTDVSAGSGISTILTSCEMPSTQILEVKGNGLGLIDYNNNGFLDVFIPNGATLADTEGGPGWRLYENLGNMTFRDVTSQAGIQHTRWALGVAVGDFNSDGWDDLYVTCYGPNVLLRNNRDGTFSDDTQPAFPEPRAENPEAPEWSTSAAFGDVTADGSLDLYVANYLDFDARNPPAPAQFLGTTVLAGPRGLAPQHDVLYANMGDGTFTDITRGSGADHVEPSYGLGVVILDFDNDGRQDIFVGNDSMRNFLFHNRAARNAEAPELQSLGVPTFRLIDRGLQSGIGSNADGGNQATMGIGIADIDGNGLPGVFTTNFSSDSNTLHLNLGNLFFVDRTAAHGLALVSRPFLGWACGFYDLDLDGHEELFMVNGHVYPQATRELMDSEYEQPPLLFKRGNGRFERVADDSIGPWLHEPRRDRAAVFADLNNNGSIDIIVGEMNGPVRVLQNESETDGAWLIVELHDAREYSANRRGLGSRVQLIATQTSEPETKNALTRWIYGGGFMSASAQYAHFGIPRQWLQNHTLDLRITWPDGHVQDVPAVELGQRLRISRDH